MIIRAKGKLMANLVRLWEDMDAELAVGSGRDHPYLGWGLSRVLTGSGWLPGTESLICSSKESSP